MGIDLSKKVEAARIVLEKKNILGVQADVVFAIDKSGSMWEEYNDGTVQELVTRMLGIAMNIDPNKSVDVYQFNSGSQHIGLATESNYANFVREKRMSVDGGTNYAPVMKQIIAEHGTPLKGNVDPVKRKGLFGGLFKKKAVEPTNPIVAKKNPLLVIFITDGSNFDEAEAEKVIYEAAEQPIFWQFVGIGNEKFEFLKKLDDLAGRYIDNADFFPVKDIKKASDEELYNSLLTEFPKWLEEAKTKGLVL